MSLAYRSFAKINRHLQVIGRRADGYHELRTVFQTIDLHDVLRFEPAPDGVELTVSGASLPAGPDNLVHRAATAFLAEWGGGRGVSIALEKHVPAGGGLGGGSSDAATALLALRDLFGIPADPLELWPIARRLGADVPYFLVGGTCLGVGRGDEILPLPELAEEEIWIAAPDVEVSTADVFATLEMRPPAALAIDVLRLAQGGSGPSDDPPAFWNDLQDSVFRRFSGVERVYTALLRGGFESVCLSGSGACLAARWLGTGEPRLDLPAGARLLRTRTLTRDSIRSRRRIA
jgi:4-diphosphocytidyl-2-C-methyl-D-erythritol kinase